MNGRENANVWLLGENDDNVLCGQAISNFRMREDNTGVYYPREVNIMFISLIRLAEENNICGELARLLLGLGMGGTDNELRTIAEMFKHEYETFKDEEGLIKSMTILEERYEEGLAVGEAMGEARGEARGVEIGKIMAYEYLLSARIAKGEPTQKIREFAAELGIGIERLNELLAGQKL